MVDTVDVVVPGTPPVLFLVGAHLHDHHHSLRHPRLSHLRIIRLRSMAPANDIRVAVRAHGTHDDAVRAVLMDRRSMPADPARRRPPTWRTDRTRRRLTERRGRARSSNPANEEEDVSVAAAAGARTGIALTNDSILPILFRLLLPQPRIFDSASAERAATFPQQLPITCGAQAHTARRC